jgi:hypothetical protein
MGLLLLNAVKTPSAGEATPPSNGHGSKPAPEISVPDPTGAGGTAAIFA